MSSPRSWLFLFLFTVSKFALFVDAKGGGKGSGSKGSKKGSKSIPQTVAYRSNGKCYNEQYAARSPLSLFISSPLFDTRHVLITCPYNKSTIITTIVLGAITGNIFIQLMTTSWDRINSKNRSSAPRRARRLVSRPPLTEEGRKIAGCRVQTDS